jgi:hypothetical protein
MDQGFQAPSSLLAAFLLLFGSHNYYSREQPSIMIDFAIVDRSLSGAIFLYSSEPKQCVKSSLDGGSLMMMVSGFQVPNI